MDVKTDILPTTSFNRQADHYAPYHGWSTTWQPKATTERCHSPIQYLSLARHGISVLDQKTTDFLQRNHLKYITVSQADFHTGFEEAPVVNGRRCSFQGWVEAERKRQGITFRPDVVYISGCVKAYKRAEDKVTDPSAPYQSLHATKDYLRSMLIFTDGYNPRQRKSSIDRMMDLKTSIIDPTDSFGALGRKDQYALPHDKSSYRGLHVVTECAIEDGSMWDGSSILGEVKFEHGSQQDVLRLSRDIQDIHRDVKKKVATMLNDCCSDPNVAREIGDYALLADKLEVTTVNLHNWVHNQLGFNDYITAPADPKKAIDYTPVSAEELNNQIQYLSRAGSITVRNMLAANSVAIPDLQTPKYLELAPLR